MSNMGHLQLCIHGWEYLSNISNVQLCIQGLEHDFRMTLEALRATKSTDARGKILCRSSEVFRVSI